MTKLEAISRHHEVIAGMWRRGMRVKAIAEAMGEEKGTIKAYIATHRQRGGEDFPYVYDEARIDAAAKARAMDGQSNESTPKQAPVAYVCWHEALHMCFGTDLKNINSGYFLKGKPVTCQELHAMVQERLPKMGNLRLGYR